MSRLEELFKQSKSFQEFQKQYINHFLEKVQVVNELDLESTVNTLWDTYQKGNKILFAGNGGSAANASHFATGIGYVSRSWDNPIRCVSLNDNPILLTSLSNDHGYERVFERQVQVLGEEGDLLVVLSVSGNSLNIIKAVQEAKKRGLKTIGLFGHDGGRLCSMVDQSIVTPTEDLQLGVAEDIHMIIGHLIAYYLEFKLKN